MFTTTDIPKWDRRFLVLAEHVSKWSKDPSTQCGAVVARGNKVLGIGYNGFASGVDDLPDRYDNRDLKYKYIIHAEINAILNAGTNLAGCTLYVFPFAPCCDCAKIVVQAGITKVVTLVPPDDLMSRWADSLKHTMIMFDEAGVLLTVASKLSDDS